MGFKVDGLLKELYRDRRAYSGSFPTDPKIARYEAIQHWITERGPANLQVRAQIHENA